jgi:acetyl-CoA C-acetyltransferase
LGLDPAEYINTTTGGNSPVMLLNRSCRDIQRGDHDVILMTGCEAMYSRLLARRAGGHIEWPQQAGEVRDCSVIGDEAPPTNNAEMAIGLILPVQIYPMLENALRHRLGRTVEEHRAVIGGLWSRFSEVAAGNVYAWSRQARTPDDIATPSAENRMVAFPYTKLLTANLQVDQAAGTIVCSVEAAQRLGVPEDRWVFPLAGAEGKDHNFLSERDDLSRSPCIAACGRALRELTGVLPADAQHVDLYSCFPIAVEIAAEELGLPLDRQLTLTGGLTFGGGPGNAYAFHGIAEAVAACRREPGSVALTSALGWYVTKHSLAMLSTTPNPRGYGWQSVQDEVDALPKRAVAEGYEGPVTLETATVAYDREGEPEKVLAAVLTPEGARGWASSADRVLADEFVAGGLLGEPAKVSGTALL